MNEQVAQLFHIAGKSKRLIVGLMSGTSMDGLDIALCSFEGSGPEMSLQLLEFQTVPYNIDFKEKISAVFARKQVDLEFLCLLNAWIGKEHGKMVVDCLSGWGRDMKEVDLVASHGQTIFHAPKTLHGYPDFPTATLQIGDGDHIAVTTGIITLSDFRQKHIAAGGEGAPLAGYGDYLMFSKRNQDRLLLNIGGIANFTYLPGSLDPALVVCSDTGPGNTMMDACIRKYAPGQFYDKDASLAKSGTVHRELLHCLLNHPFFEQPLPKTTGPELFNLAYLEAAQQTSGTHDLSLADIMATLNAFSASSITRAIQQVVGKVQDVHLFVSGGGMHNPLLSENIRAMLPGAVFESTDQLGINPDAKEAVLFAVLANETVSGGKANLGSGRNGMPDISMGKISFPR